MVASRRECFHCLSTRTTIEINIAQFDEIIKAARIEFDGLAEKMFGVHWIRDICEECEARAIFTICREDGRDVVGAVRRP